MTKRWQSWMWCLIGLAMLGLPGSVRAEDGLVAHWPLDGDTNDRSRNAWHARNHGVTFSAGGPNGRQAANFDGIRSYLDVPQEKLELGTGDFSILVYVHTADKLVDVLGDVVSKYDFTARRGWNLSIDCRPGVTSSQSNWRNVHFGMDQGSQPQWQDHGRLGNAVLIFSMAVFDGQLFAGTCEPGADQSGRVFRFNGQRWIDCGAPDRCNAVTAMAVHRGELYVGVGKYRLGGSALEESPNPNLGGKVYRYDGDGQWTLCGQLPNVQSIGGMLEYDGQLYAGSMYAPAGFFRYDGDSSWSTCPTPGKRVESLGMYNGHLYASGYDEGAVYRHDGKAWEHLGILGDATQTYGFGIHRGRLFVSEWPHARVFRLTEDNKWHLAGAAGEEKETMPLAVYNGKLYVGTLPSAQVYRLDELEDGEHWTPVGTLDRTPDVKYRRVWSMAVYRGRLFCGLLPSGHVHSMSVGANVTHDSELSPGWRHLAVVKQGDRLKLYTDGQLVATSANFDPKQFNIDTDQRLTIGFGANDYFNGRMSDLRIYNRAVSESEIQTICRP